MSEYSDELARVQAKNADRKREIRILMRANRLLKVVGWSATADDMRAAAAEMSQVDRIEDDELEAAIARALELQKDETVRGRRLRPEEADMPKTYIDKSTREKIRDYVFNRRRNEPDLTAGIALVDVNEMFGAQITEANFYATYWKPRDSQATNGNGAKPYVHMNGANPTAAAKETAKKSTRSKAPARPRKTPKKEAARTARVAHVDAVVTSPPSAQVTDAGEPVVIGGPILQLYALSNGQLRVQADMDIDRLTRVLHAVTARED